MEPARSTDSRVTPFSDPPEFVGFLTAPSYQLFHSARDRTVGAFCPH